MSNFGDHPAGFFGKSEFYNGVTSSSLRANHGDSPGLKRTGVTGTSRRIFTHSSWVKRNGIFTQTENLLSVSPNNNDTNAFQYGFRDKDDTDGPNVQLSHYNGSGFDFRVETTAKLRDVSSWYHLVLRVDTTQGTDSNRIRIYINGVLQTALAQNTYPSQNFDTSLNVANTIHYMAGGAAANAGGGNVYFDSYVTEINYVDGLSLGPDSFGEFKNDVWIPIDTSALTFGNNGTRLQFKNSGTGTTNEGTTATTNIGDDSSGNGHNFAVINYVASDIVPDNPENNFCTLNSNGRRYGQSYVGTFSEGNLKVATTGNATNVFGTMAINQIASQGGVYFEVRMDSLDTSRTYFGVVGDTGINNQNAYSNAGGYTFPIKGMLSQDPRAHFGTNTDGSSTDLRTGNTVFSDGEVIGIAILSDGKFFAHREGTYLKNASGNVGNPSTGANPIATIDLTLGDWFPYLGYNSSFSINFGQDGSFQGNETSGGNQDGNGIGDFMFAVPTNCFAICSSNMAEPTIGPNSGEASSDYFNVVGYTGNGGALSVTGFDHQPDLLWIKSRSITGNHRLTDSSRGVSFNWITNTDDGEKGDGDAEDIDSFDTDGFTVTQASYDDFNDGSDTYLAFSWKANGGTDTATGNEDGNNPGYNQQANSKAGFSIIKYVGTQAAGTIPHGLGKKPDWMIFKNREVNGNAPIVYHSANTAAPATDHLALNSGALSADNANRFNDTEPTSSVFTLGADGNINDNGVTCIAYIWTGIEGFSKFGSYTGNSDADGVFIYLGFRPAWVMYKASAGVGNNWHINYPKLVDNENNKYVLGNGDGSEGSANAIDFLSNGFKFRHSSQAGNNSSGAYIYMAFAEAPFKYSNAR